MGYFDWHGEICPGDVVRHLPLDAHVLDLGCGTGWLAERVARHVGLDGSPDAVQAAAELGRDVRLWRAGDAVPFEDGTFGAAVLKDVLEHLDDPVSVVSEVHRVLSPGGVVLASVPDAQRWVWDDYTHRRPFTRKAFRLLFADAGFAVERVAYESVMPGTSILAGRTGRHRRPPILVAAAWLPVVRRNVTALARRPA